jgi:hypothetical protein
MEEKMMHKYRWEWILLITIFFPQIVSGAKGKYKKDGELYYQIFRENVRVGYAHSVFHVATQNNIKWVRIEQERKEEIKGMLSGKAIRDHSVIMLRNNQFYSLKSKGEKDGDPYEVEIKKDKAGLHLVVTADKKMKEGVFSHSEYDYTSIDPPSSYLKLYNTPYKLNIFDLDEREVLPTTFTLKRQEKMEDYQAPFNCWVIRVENKSYKKTDWITPGGILIQSIGSDRYGSFLIRATSKEKALVDSNK